MANNFEKSLHAGAVLVGSIATITADGFVPGAGTALGVAMSSNTLLAPFFAPTRDLGALADKLLSKQLKKHAKSLPEGGELTIREMAKVGLPDPSALTTTQHEAEAIVSVLLGQMTKPEHKLGEMTEAFRRVVAPVVAELLQNPHFKEALSEARSLATAREASEARRLTESGNEEIMSRLDELAARIGVTNALANPAALSLEDLNTLAERFGAEPSDDAAALVDFLTLKADEYRTYKAQIDELDERVAAIANLKGAAQDAAERLDFDTVEDLLAQVDITETAIAAETKLARARNALLRGRVEQAYDILSAAADSFASVEPTAPAQLRLQFMQLLHSHGLRYGGLGLALSERMTRAALDQIDRPSQPRLWGHAHNSLAIALRNQASRSEGPEAARLFAEAVTAYRDALEVYTRDDHPEDWAMTTQNLAVALQEQAKRSEGPEAARLFAEATAAYRDALEVYTREDHPVAWARTTQNLATALRNQASRSEGPEAARLFAEATAAYRDALEVYTRDDHPVHWAMTTQNLANALQGQASRSEGPEAARLFAEAVAAYRDALTIRTREDQPFRWAQTQVNLAVCELSWAAHADTAAPRPHLDAALAHVDNALEIYDPETLPYDHGTATRLRGRIRAALDALAP